MPDVTRSISIPLGVVIAREEVESPWLDQLVRPAAVIVGDPGIEIGAIVHREPGCLHTFAGTFELELHRRETEAYRVNLANQEPSVYVVAHEADDDESQQSNAPALEIHLVTVSAFEAQDYLDTGEDIVEALTMPETLVAWVQRFIDMHHVEEKFIKRRRDKVDLSEQKFGKEPIFATTNRPGRRNG